ncbi:glycosyltransferase family 4 protein [Shewanella salipaludis]|uniref:Glycosyltransferase family 4 protein n=1 Tax=Shewanella salipaludis TaxID=2723052 RepID=A0A972FSH2_9GAMM|nr:glycosyltransferase family 4 protein [Shewanella salipaludis]NMH65365.1 glycosyltransferase family 4 protein [Shewanella salipaludis]
MATVFITNIPAPYREQVHEITSEKLDGNYHVIYCSSIEKNRKWKFEFGNYTKTFLTCKVINFRGRTIYLASDIRRVLNTVNPEVVIIGGFSLPMIIAYVWAIFKNRKVISFSDANMESEKNLNVIHKLVRKFFYGKSHAFIGASQKTLKLFRRYGARKEQLFQSHLCANNVMYSGVSEAYRDRDFDIILCGQMIKGKMFDFSLDVISLLQKTHANIKIKLLGSGPLQSQIIKRLEQMQVSYDYPGFVEQNLLPQHYATAKIFFFPSTRDAWGVVANEACAAGTPVFTCPVVGAADELVLDGHNGYILEANAQTWADNANRLLENAELWENLSANAIRSVTPYTYYNAALGIIDASRYVRGIDEN